jgi:PKD repeat protein
VLSNLAGGTLPNLGIGLSDPGFDNPLNPTTPTIGDPFQETFTGYTIDWGDGTAETPVTVVMRESGMAGPPTTLTTALFEHAAHTYADDGVYTVRIRVADDNMTGDFTTGTNGVDFIDLTFTITVLNVNPTLAGFTSTTTTINEAGSVSFNIDFSDPGFDNPLNPTTPATGDPLNESFTYDINWGDGRQTLSAVAVADNNGSPGIPSTGTFGGSHIYADDGTYTVTVVVRDDNGGTDTHVFTVIVQNVDPSFVPTPDGASFEGDAVTSMGFTQIRVAFSDPGFDNTANPNPDEPPNVTDTLHESFTHVFDWGDGTVDALHTYIDAGVYTVNLTITGPNGTQTFSFAGLDSNQLPILTLVSGQDINDPSVAAQPYTFVVDWGDGAVQTIPLMLRNPAAPLFNNGLTTVLASQRISGNEGILTTGSFEVQHRYTSSPNPANPTEDIQITTTIIDDNNGSVSDFILVTNPGISSNIIAFDTTPQVPRLEFVPTQMTEIFLGDFGSSVLSLQTRDVRVARSDQNLTSDVYLELRVVFPDGSESEGYRLPEDALQNLRDIFAKLPDNRYRIYLVRTENNSYRLVTEVVVRGGRVVDPSDDSEGTRDRPPTSEQNTNAVPLDQHPLLRQVPDQGPINPSDGSQTAIEPTSKDGRMRDAIEIEPVGQDVGNETLQPLSPQVPVPAPSFSRNSRWAVPLAACGLTVVAAGWSKQLEAAMESADRAAWQRLRRAGRLGRIIRHTPTPEPHQKSALREYNEKCS